VLSEKLSYLKASDLKLVRKAFHFADEAHLGQYRQSGEPYITHPLAVAELCAEWKLDVYSIMSALLHDVIEDTGHTYAELIETFGQKVGELVDGLTKLDKLEFQSHAQAQAFGFDGQCLGDGEGVAGFGMQVERVQDPSEGEHDFVEGELASDARSWSGAVRFVDVRRQCAESVGQEAVGVEGVGVGAPGGGVSVGGEQQHENPIPSGEVVAAVGPRRHGALQTPRDVPTLSAMRNAFVARQPIFDVAGSIAGYELLYRHTADAGWAAGEAAGDAMKKKILKYGIGLLKAEGK
jgi:hypothetical protein